MTRLDKLNRDIFTLTVGKKFIPPMALKLSKKQQRLKYKQYRRGLHDNRDAVLSMMALTDGSDGIPTVAELLESPLAKYITLAANNCGYIRGCHMVDIGGIFQSPSMPPRLDHIRLFLR